MFKRFQDNLIFQLLPPVFTCLVYKKDAACTYIDRGKNEMLPNLLLEKKTNIKEMTKRFRGIHSYDPARKKTKLPGPLNVQIQTIDQCNATCIMCPYSHKNIKGRPNHMDEGLYRRILYELKQTGSVIRFTPMLQNEPLMDREIAKRVGEAKEVLGSSTTVSLVTNGSLLNSSRVEELLNAGIDELSVSVNAFTEETYRSIHKGLHFSKVVKNLEYLLQRNPRIIVVARFFDEETIKIMGLKFLLLLE